MNFLLLLLLGTKVRLSQPVFFPVGILIRLIEILSCYVCFEFLTQAPGNHDHLSATNPDNAFRTEVHKSEISWTLQSDPAGPADPTNPNSDPLFRSVDFRSTLNIGWIPDNGVDFFTLFIIDLHNKWRVLFDAADSHLTLSVGGFCPFFFHHLLLLLYVSVMINFDI